MIRQLLKTMLLLCALMAGSGSVWAEDITVLSADFNSGSATGWTLDGKTSYQGSTNEKALQLASGNGAGSATTPAFSSLVGSTATLTFSIASSGSNTNTLTITGNNCKVNGNSSTTAQTDAGTVTIDITNASTTSTITFSAVKGGGVRIDDVRVYYTKSSDPSSACSFTQATPSINYPATKTYSQVASTADGYTGTVTYEITENTADATIEGSTVTVNKGGSVTVKATAPAVSGSFSSSSATYTLTVNDTRTSPGLAWSAESASVTYNKLPYDLPTLTNAHGLEVTYASTNESVATIDENGDLTIKNETGSTKISATFNGNDDFLSETVSYTLNVTEGAYEIIDGVFDFVKAGSSNPVIDYGSGVTLSSGDYVTASKTWTAGNVTMVTARVSGSGYRWWSNDHTLRFYNESKATISVPSGYVITKIVTTGANFDKANGEKLGASTWTGMSNEVTLTATDTRNIKTITVTYAPTATITLASACTDGEKYYGTYSNSSSFVVPDGLTVSAVSVSGGALTITNYKKDDIVKANTGVLVSATSAGNKTVALSAEEGTEIDGNMLKASSVAMTQSDTKFYRLTMHNANEEGKDAVIGFWWGAADGAAFAVGANKAYLAVPNSALASARQGFSLFGEGEVNGIQNAHFTMHNGDGAVYNLNGQRVEKAKKGLYIKNGKKVVVK